MLRIVSPSLILILSVTMCIVFLWHMHQGQKLFPIGETLLLHTKLHMATRSWHSNKFTSTTLPSGIRISSCESLFIWFIKLSLFVGSVACAKTYLYSSFPSQFSRLTQDIKPLSSSNSNNTSLCHLDHNVHENQYQVWKKLQWIYCQSSFHMTQP